MKGLLFTVSIVCLLMVGCTKAKDDRWVYAGHSEFGNNTYYYDKESIVKVDKDITKVWLKTVYSEKGKQNLIKDNGKEYENLSFAVDQINLNCSSREYYIAYRNWYDTGGNPIKGSGESYGPKWQPMIPGTGAEDLYKIVCKK